MFQRLFLGTLAVLILLGIGRVRMDVDVLELLPDELPEVQGLRLFLEHFSKEGELIILIEGNDADETESHHRALADSLRTAQPSLGDCVSDELWSLDSTDALGELVAWLLLNASSEEAFAESTRGLTPENRLAVLEDSLDTIAASMELDQALALAYDPYQLLHRLRRDQASLLDAGQDFVSADGSLRLLYLTAPDGAAANYRATIDWVNRVKAHARDWQATLSEPESIQLGFTGEPVFAAEISASMRRDMLTSGVAALFLTALVFIVAYRQLKPLLALMASLTFTFALTLGAAGWGIPSMTVMSVGFASILIGLTVDYGVIVYQSSLSGSLTPAQLRRQTRPSIVWAAATTAAAFGALSLSVVPGIATLGQLVAVGIIMGAVVMLLVFPGLLPSNDTVGKKPHLPLKPWPWLGHPAVVLATAILIAALSLSTLWLGLPDLDTSTAALRPRDSAAYDAMDRLESHFTGASQSGLALVRLDTRNGNPLEQLDVWEERLASFPGDYRLPRALVAHPDRQQNNLAGLTEDQLDIDTLKARSDEAEFEAEAMELTSSILTHWRAWRSSNQIPASPSSTAADRLWSQLLASDEAHGAMHLLLSLTPTNEEDDTAIWEWMASYPEVAPVSWPRVTIALNERVPGDLLTVAHWLGIAVVAMLLLTFRRWQECLLSLSLTAVTLISLSGAMGWLGWEWNFFSLGALLLTFGAGLDYSIHILLDDRRHGGDVQKLRQGVIRALAVCSLSTVAGFGSIAWASNQGLASLGRVCALALALNALVALILLPWLIERLRQRRLL